MGTSVPVYPASRCAPRRRTFREFAAGAVTYVCSRAQSWRERYRMRCHLAAMGDRDLNDLGLSPSSIEYEINKPFWRD